MRVLISTLFSSCLLALLMPLQVNAHAVPKGSHATTAPMQLAFWGPPRHHRAYPRHHRHHKRHRNRRAAWAFGTAAALMTGAALSRADRNRSFECRVWYRGRYRYGTVRVNRPCVVRYRGRYLSFNRYQVLQ